MKITSDLSVRSAPSGEHPVRGARGLFLRVHLARDSSLTRSWIVRLSGSGKRPKRGLGQYPVVTLAAACQKAIDAYRAFAEGNDPGVSARRRHRAAEEARSLTLGKAVDGYLADAAPKYKNPKSAQIRERALRIHFAPLHSRDVASITAADVAGILRALAAETAMKAQTDIRRVFDYATTTLEPHGVSIINPADPRRLRSVGWAPKPSSASTPYPAVDWRVVPEVVAELSKAKDVASACVLFIISTAVRAKTARLAKWSDIDHEKRVWTVPLADLKDGKHHKRPYRAAQRRRVRCA